MLNLKVSVNILNVVRKSYDTSQMAGIKNGVVMTNNTPRLGQIPSGYSQFDEYIAQKTTQGRRTHYLISMPIVQIPTVLPVPDPSIVLDDNREIRPNHAKSFADYVRKNTNWHCGPLTVRTSSDVVSFVPFEGGDYGPLSIGMLRVPRNSRTGFRIIDGQHRVLGVDTMLKDINDDLIKRRADLKGAKDSFALPPVLKQYENKIASLTEQLDRAQNETIAIDLIVEDDPDSARQIFVDVANNALGISKSVTSRFDQRKVVNRALQKLLSDPNAAELINNRIDQEKDRVVGSNPNLMGATHLTDIIRTIEVGISGRVSDAMEKTLDEQQLARSANAFFEVLTKGFPDFQSVADGSKQVGDLREGSLLFSTTMLRVLAGVYHELKQARVSDDQFVLFFSKLNKLMKAPVAKGTPAGDLWLSCTTSQAFSDGLTAPGARAQQVKELVAVIASWYSSPPALLK